MFTHNDPHTNPTLILDGPIPCNVIRVRPLHHHLNLI